MISIMSIISIVSIISIISYRMSGKQGERIATRSSDMILDGRDFLITVTGGEIYKKYFV
jgi:hypothetical protein